MFSYFHCIYCFLTYYIYLIIMHIAYCSDFTFKICLQVRNPCSLLNPLRRVFILSKSWKLVEWESEKHSSNLRSMEKTSDSTTENKTNTVKHWNRRSPAMDITENGPLWMTKNSAKLSGAVTLHWKMIKK